VLSGSCVISFFFNIRNYSTESNLSTILIRIVGTSTYDPSQHRISDIPDEYELTRVASIVVLSVKVTRVSHLDSDLYITIVKMLAQNIITPIAPIVSDLMSLSF
jgi:hypothetical protein